MCFAWISEQTAIISLYSINWLVSYPRFNPLKPSGYYMYHKLYVKCTLVQALRLCTGRTAHSGSRGITLIFLDHSTRRGWADSFRPPGKTRYPFYRRLGGPQGRSGQVGKISPSTGIQSPDRPARSQSLCRLRYPAHTTSFKIQKFRVLPTMHLCFAWISE